MDGNHMNPANGHADLPANQSISREREYYRILDASLPIGTALLQLPEAPGSGVTLLHVGGTMVAELGYTREEYEAFQRMDLRGFVYDEDYGTLFHSIDMEAEELPASFEQEYRVVEKSGKIRWMCEKGLLVNVDGARAYAVASVDITARKEMEERLRVSEEELRYSMSQVGKMVCLYDVATRTLTMPEAYAKKHGLQPVLENIPVSVAALGMLGDHGGLEFNAFYEAILRGEKSGEAEVRLKCADGSWCWEHGEFATIFDRDGKPVKAVVAVEDTTLNHSRDDETEALRESERVFRVVVKHSNRVIFRYDLLTRSARTDSPTVLGKKHFSAEYQDLPESVIRDGLILPESVDDFRRVFSEIHAGKRDDSVKLHMRDIKGEMRWMDMRYSLIDGDDGKPSAAVVSFEDISEDHEREVAYERYRQEISNEARAEGLVYFETDLTADVVEKQGGNMPSIAFPAAGCRHEDAVRYGIEHLLPEDVRNEAWTFFSREKLLTAFADGTRNLEQDFPVELPGGQKRWFRAGIQMIRDPYSQHVNVYTTMRDVTSEILAAMDVRKQAETDGMTGLYNKATTEAMVRKKLAAAGGEPCILLIADLDSLKSINDSLGHAQGDRAIQFFANTLKRQFRHSDIVGRIGGDEFLAFLDGAGNETMMRSTMNALMRKIAAIRIGENDDVPMHGSVGVAFGAAGKDTFEELYRMADKALYHVKRNGKNDFAFYTKDMDEAACCYKPHDETTLWQADALDRLELDHLLFAVSSIYPLVISVNLTENSYYMMQYNHFTTTAVHDAGVFDELIQNGAMTYHPDDRDSFLRTFSRENLLEAHARGEKRVTHRGRQLGDDGVYRNITTDVIFVQDGSGDVLEITLARESTSTGAWDGAGSKGA